MKQIWGFHILRGSAGDQAPRTKASNNPFFDTYEDDTDDIDADYSNNDDTSGGGHDTVVS